MRHIQLEWRFCSVFFCPSKIGSVRHVSVPNRADMTVLKDTMSRWMDCTLEGLAFWNRTQI